jgi:hypothetical protein
MRCPGVERRGALSSEIMALIDAGNTAEFRRPPARFIAKGADHKIIVAVLSSAIIYCRLGAPSARSSIARRTA